MKQLTAKAFEHANVMGKKLQYVRITNGSEEYIINVGIKTYEALTKLESEPANNETTNNEPNGDQVDLKNSKGRR